MIRKFGFVQLKPGGLAVAVAVLCLAGAGRVAAGEIALQPIPGGDFRFKDVLGQAYGAAFIAGFAYTGNQVRVTLDSTNRHFSGRLVATGLKPNFAYQVKLVGDPALAGDPTNDRLGFLGRWWEVAPNPGNVTDAERSAHMGDPNYVFQGYLLFGFFVTDDQGNADVTFQARSSLHVLWRVDQRAPGANDSALMNFLMPPTAGNPAYDVALAERFTLLYGEYEPTRALPGQLLLPAGHYRCSLVLTEESFHDAGALAGTWAAALGEEIEFDVSAAAPVIVSGPTATPSSVRGTTATLAALASDDGGEADLVYTWSVQAKPHGAADPTFSLNASNAAKTTVVTFSHPGTYRLCVTIRDLDAQTASATVDVQVNDSHHHVSASCALGTTPVSAGGAAGWCLPYAALALGYLLVRLRARARSRPTED